MKLNYLYNPEIRIPDYLLSRIKIEELIAGKGIISGINSFFNLYSAKILLLCDQNTYHAAGIAVEKALSESNTVTPLILNSNIHCDSETADVTEYELKDMDILVSVGSGTINDIGRLVAHRNSRNFYSVATAPSMDGYLSANSSVIEDGVKISHSDITPAVKVIIDMDVINKAPDRLFLSGIGDSIAKILSVFDWLLDSQVRKGPFSKESFDHLNKSLAMMIEILISDDTYKYKPVLTEFLLLSSAVMNAEKNSQPASGGEHLVGHVLEMFDLKRNVSEHSLHGEKVGVATRLLFDRYLDYFSSGKFFTGNFHLGFPADAYFEGWKYYDIKIQEKILLKKLDIVSSFNFQNPDFQKNIAGGVEHLKNLKNLFLKVYDKFGLPADSAGLNISENDLNFAMLHAGDIRDRITGLDLINFSMKRTD